MPSFVALLGLGLFFDLTLAAPGLGILNELGVRQSSCPDVQVYFARGTTETPTLGTLVGPYFYAAVLSQLSDKAVNFEGVDYPATFAGYLAGGDDGGATTMANAVTSMAGVCPDTKIVISGYSQGAQVTHLAASKLSTAVQDRVAAVITFGDPTNTFALPGALGSRWKSFCNSDDSFCNGDELPSADLAPHLMYSSDASAAAEFIEAQV